MAFRITQAESADSPVTWYVRGAVVRVGTIAIELGSHRDPGHPQSTPTYSDEQLARYVAIAVDRLTG